MKDCAKVYFVDHFFMETLLLCPDEKQIICNLKNIIINICGSLLNIY